MKPFGLSVIESCLTCPLREDRLFCDLPDRAVAEMESIKNSAMYPKGAFLCLEGQPARGIHILCNGRAKITASDSEGKTVILSIAAPGEVLGLSAVISGKPYEVSVETVEPTQANFISRSDFMNLLSKYPEVGLKVAQQLTHTCQSAFKEIRSLGLSHSVPERLAQLLFQWTQDKCFARKHHEGQAVLKVASTQEEIAQMIGTSRETVSRTLADFKKRGLLKIKGVTWTIPDVAALERQAHL
jgi:CRP/FNR family cyclic AMP-dependent transcriptional regulator